MKLNKEGLKDRQSWEKAGYALPSFDRDAVTAATKENPFWIHFGAGNIFRTFQANVVQDLLNQGVLDRDLVVVDLKFIPLVFAGWLRYLMGVDDNGKAFTLISDPRLEELTAIVSGISLGASTDVQAVLGNVLSDAFLWGVDLKALGMDTIVCRYFKELIAGPGAVAAVLNKYTS